MLRTKERDSQAQPVTHLQNISLITLGPTRARTVIKRTQVHHPIRSPNIQVTACPVESWSSAHYLQSPVPRRQSPDSSQDGMNGSEATNPSSVRCHPSPSTDPSPARWSSTSQSLHPRPVTGRDGQSAPSHRSSASQECLPLSDPFAPGPSPAGTRGTNRSLRPGPVAGRDGPSAPSHRSSASQECLPFSDPFALGPSPAGTRGTNRSLRPGPVSGRDSPARSASLGQPQSAQTPAACTHISRGLNCSIAYLTQGPSLAE